MAMNPETPPKSGTGEWLRWQRRRAGFSQADLANAWSVRRATIIRWEQSEELSPIVYDAARWLLIVVAGHTVTDRDRY